VNVFGKNKVLLIVQSRLESQDLGDSMRCKRSAPPPLMIEDRQNRADVPGKNPGQH